MQPGKKLWIKIAAAVVIGLFIAYTAVGITHVTRPCTPADVPQGESISRCKVIAKAFIQPHDLLINKQDRLTHFSEIFVVASLASFALFSVLGLAQQKRA
jgi:hypothetical protein